MPHTTVVLHWRLHIIILLLNNRRVRCRLVKLHSNYLGLRTVFLKLTQTCPRSFEEDCGSISQIIFPNPDYRIHGFRTSRQSLAAGTGSLACGVDELLENTLGGGAFEPGEERPCDRVGSGGVSVLRVDVSQGMNTVS